MKRSYLHIGRTLLAFGIISIFLGVITFFPVFSYKPWFAGWSAKIACPIWNGAVALIVGLLVLLEERDPGLQFLRMFALPLAIVNLIASPLQFVIALAAILIGPLCYYSLAGITGTGYLGFAVQFPYGYSPPTVCVDPPLYEYYHLVLQLTSLLLSAVIFSLSLLFSVRLTVRFNATGTLTGQRWRW
ncbi:transmembrane protein 212-like [Scyliorhinus torazame]|uniref:transmembrane protein 212-like n=1 Tax=Scyliorhinus torazame TaxID=75743 RepID=UPI003B5A7159